MASTLDCEPWLLVLEAVRNHCNEERFQHFVLDMMWERGKIELAYVKSLQQWADHFTNKCMDKDAPYDSPVIDVLIQTTREARSQASQHQRLYNALMSGDGPCAKLRTAITDLRNGIMPAKSQRVFTTLVSQFISMHNQKKEYENNVAKWKEHYAQAQSTAIEIGGKTNTKRNNPPLRPLSARKMENVEGRQFHFKKFANVQDGQLNGAEQVLSDFLHSQSEPLKSMQEDLGFFAMYRLADLVQMIKLFMQRLQSHERSSERKEKRKTLQDCEKFLNDISVSKFSEDYQENLKIKLNQIVKKKLATDYDPECFSAIDIGEGFTSDLLSPEAPTSSSEQNFPEMEIYAVQHYHDKQLHLIEPAPEVTTTTTDNNPGCEGKYPFMARQQKKLHSPQFLRRTKPNVSANTYREARHTVTPTNSTSETIEVLELPVENDTLSRERLPWPVRDFCTGPDEDSEHSLEPSRQRIKKRMVCETVDAGNKTEVTAFCEQHDQSERSSTSGDSKNDSTNGEAASLQDVVQTNNVRVMALADFKASDENELTFSKGQVIHQKWGPNDRGFCYGWTKISKFSSKKYGQYPSSLVQILDN